MSRTSDRVFSALAVGRVVWGVAAYLAPKANADVVGAGDRVTPEVAYLTRIFGGRAVALGVGYLLSDPAARARWQRLGLLVDTADTVAGLVQLRGGGVPKRAAVTLLVATATYAAIGAIGLAGQQRR